MKEIMTSTGTWPSDQVKDFYDVTATETPGFSLMNYGYAASNMDDVADKSDLEYYCLQLYHHVLRGTDLKGKRVIEIGCGRGGGARFVKQTYAPAFYQGLDLSDGNISLARSQFSDVDGLEFEVGNSQELPYAENEFDAAINVESSHLYEEREKFFSEVVRVLRPGGYFFYADIFDANANPILELESSGFVILANDDITANVLEALRRVSDRRARDLEATLEPESQAAYKDWAGVKDYAAYNRLLYGDWVYLSFMLRPSRDAG